MKIFFMTIIAAMAIIIFSGCGGQNVPVSSAFNQVPLTLGVSYDLTVDSDIAAAVTNENIKDAPVFNFPDGGHGTLTVTPITDAPLIPFDKVQFNTGFRLQGLDNANVELRIPKNPYSSKLYIYLPAEGCYDWINRPVQDWFNIPLTRYDENYNYFKLPRTVTARSKQAVSQAFDDFIVQSRIMGIMNPEQYSQQSLSMLKLLDSLNAEDKTAVQSNMSGANALKMHIALNRPQMPSSSIFTGLGSMTGFSIPAMPTIGQILSQFGPSGAVFPTLPTGASVPSSRQLLGSSLMGGIGGSLFSSLLNTPGSIGGIGSYPSTVDNAGFYENNRMCGPYMRVSSTTTEDTITHLSAHYLTSMLMPSEKWLNLQRKSPRFHTFGLSVSRGNSLADDYAYYLQWLSKASDPPSQYEDLAGYYQQNAPWQLDSPSRDGFTAMLLRQITSKASLKDFTNADSEIPLQLTAPSEVVALIKNGDSSLNELLPNLNTFFNTHGGRPGELAVLAERTGWSYHASGYVKINGKPAGNVKIKSFIQVQNLDIIRTYTTPEVVSSSTGFFALPRLFPGTQTIRFTVNNKTKDIPLNIDWSLPTNDNIIIPDVILEDMANSFTMIKDSPDFQLKGTASWQNDVNGDFLRLASAYYNQNGSIFYKNPFAITKDFTTSFTFRYTPSNGADGITFVIWSTPPADSVNGVSPFALDLDTYQNASDPNANHIDFIKVLPGQSADVTTFAELPVNMTDGNPHTLTVSYQSGILKITLDEGIIYNQAFNMSAYFPEGNGSFSLNGRTYSVYQNHDILAWSGSQQLFRGRKINTK